jgi:electron transfer flavoprotein alpha subunit
VTAAPTLVLVEHTAAGATPLSMEALTFARTIGGPVHALVVGSHPSTVLDQLAEQGVEAVHHPDDPRLGQFAAAAWARVAVQAASASGADAVLAAGSPRGFEVMAHAGAMLDAPVAANCTQVRTGQPWTATRQIMGGSVLEELTLSGPPHLLTVASHAVVVEPADAPTQPEVRPFTAALRDDDLAAQLVAVEGDAAGGVDLAGAKVVVGGGRGVGGADSFGELIELADQLGGVLGVSRVVTSQGWRPHHEQVGQTGTKIAPDLYVACGISGAIQHMAGCQSAKTILAINTDADAPMVTRADYAVIGDLHAVLPAINAELRRRRGQAG